MSDTFDPTIPEQPRPLLENLVADALPAAVACIRHALTTPGIDTWVATQAAAGIIYDQPDGYVLAVAMTLVALEIARNAGETVGLMQGEQIGKDFHQGCGQVMVEHLAVAVPAALRAIVENQG